MGPSGIRSSRREPAEAARVKAARYFTGRPCVRGHLAERFVTGGACVECNRENAARRRKTHPEQTRASVLAAHLKYDYSESHRRADRNWRLANPARVQAYSRQSYAKSDPVYWRVKRAERRARLKQQMPVWADKTAIVKIYEKCPFGHHVDHVIPLRGRSVSGLHVESNLQYLTARANHRKHNRFEDAHA